MSIAIVFLVAFIFLLPLTALTTYFSYSCLAVFFVSYFLRVFALTAGYHRYFSHKSFKTSRTFAFLMAAIASTALQGGPLWWASKHRHHHRTSDTPEDVHSPAQHGFWYSHMLWFMYKRNLKAHYGLIKDFSKFPEIRFLDRYWFLMPLVLIGILYLLGGWNWVVWGFCVPAVFINHGTYAVNSLVHVFGKRRFNTKDDSRNNWFVALITFGEGWHNNHHRYSGSARQGFAWYEIDMTYYLLKFLSLFSVVWDLKPVPTRILEEGGLVSNKLNKQEQAR